MRFHVSKTLRALLCGGTAVLTGVLPLAVRADLQVPTAPISLPQPLPEGAGAVPVQVEPSPAPTTPAGQAAPQAVPDALRQTVLAAVRSIVAEAPGTVLVGQAAQPDRPAGPTEVALAATNVAEGAVAAQVRIAVAVGETLEGGGLLGKPRMPVTLTITREGQAPINQTIAIDPAEQAAGLAALRALLIKQLTPTPAPSAPATSTVAQQAPMGLKLWMQTQDGAPPKLGSKVAIYWQAAQDGYFSLYHFSSSGGVELLFPNAALTGNFVTAGQTYRFPAEGFMTFAGPAGTEAFRAIITAYPSNTPRTLPGGLTMRQQPLEVVPITQPMLFAERKGHLLTRLFALPPQLYGEANVTYALAR